MRLFGVFIRIYLRQKRLLMLATVRRKKPSGSSWKVVSYYAATSLGQSCVVVLNTLRNLDTSKLSTEAKAGVKFTHANLLVELVKRAPEANSQFYRQQLESFIGRDEASRRLNLREQTNV